MQVLNPGSKNREKSRLKCVLKFREMKLSASNIKKFLIFQETETLKTFLYFRKWNPALFNPSSKKIKKFAPRKFRISQETETLKEFIIFSKKKAFPKFKKMDTPIKIHYIWGNGSPESFFYISGSSFPSLKSKKNPLFKSFLYFGKWNFLAPSLKNFSCFMREFGKAEK